MRSLMRLLLRVAWPKLLAALPALIALVRARGRKAAPSLREERTEGPIERAFASGTSDVVLTQSGVVITELPDDTQGDKHQRILVELDSGLTVLIAHNIDLAPRVTNPQRGEPIRFKGEYEFNDKGGVVHWTHHDPRGWHDDGWIEYDGNVYG